MKTTSDSKVGNRFCFEMRWGSTHFIMSMVATLCASAAAQPWNPFSPPAERDAAAQISEYVRRVFQDRDGVFWFGTNGDGVCRHDGTSLTYLSVEQGFGGRAVRAILQDARGAMWFATDGGVSQYIGRKFTNYTAVNGLSDNEVWSLMLDRAGTIWAGTQSGVCRFNGKSFVPFALPRAEVADATSRFNPSVVWTMVEDQRGNIWFGTDGEGARKYDGNGFTTFTSKSGLAGDNVRCIYEDRRGRIWLGTDGNGVSCYDGTSFKNYAAKDGLNNDRVFGVIEDNAGHMWFSTLGAGACRFDGKSFTAFGKSDGLTHSHVQSMFEDRDGQLWFGCSGGLFRLVGSSFVNVTRSGPWTAAATSTAPYVHAKAADMPAPLAGFARMVGGEWKMTSQSGMSMYNTWHWGPGRHSLRVMTHGLAADGSPWRALGAVYYHPGHKEVRTLGLSPFRGSVAEGVSTFDGDRSEGIMDMYQTGDRRKLKSRWAFAGPDQYHDELLETTGPGGYFTLAEWDWFRVAPSRLTNQRLEKGGAKPSDQLKALVLLLDHKWEARVGAGAAATGDWAGGNALRIESAIDWIPYANGIYMRVERRDKDGAATHLLDAYCFHHTGRNVPRCLALSNVGGVYAGDITVLDGGALQLDLTSHERDRNTPCVVRIDFERDGAVRQRVWTLGVSDQRVLKLDVHHKLLGPK